MINLRTRDAVVVAVENLRTRHAVVVAVEKSICGQETQFWWQSKSADKTRSSGCGRKINFLKKKIQYPWKVERISEMFSNGLAVGEL